MFITFTPIENKVDKLMKMNWSDLNPIGKGVLVEHNKCLPLYDVDGSKFAVGSFVRCKINGAIRYITDKNTDKTFQDDGEVSGYAPSPYCYYKSYTLIIQE